MSLVLNASNASIDLASAPVLRCTDVHLAALRSVLGHFGLTILQVYNGETIPGSYWGDSEAGLILNSVYVRSDTPVHSVLHEACHYICMDQQRREQLHTNAGGSVLEENAVCYLQILLADFLPLIGRERLLSDMDCWGYSFRLGSAKAWFEQDAEDARAWLIAHQLIDEIEKPCWRVRI